MSNDQMITQEDDEEERIRLENAEIPSVINFQKFTSNESGTDKLRLSAESAKMIQSMRKNRKRFASIVENANITDLWSIDKPMRYALYRHWLSEYIHSLIGEI